MPCCFTSNMRCTSETCGPSVSFGGILYLHSIDQVRTNSGPQPWPAAYLSPPLNSRLLLMTSKWDQPVKGESTYQKREAELTGNMWKRTLDGGAQICRSENTEQSAWKAINILVNLPPLALGVVQREFDRICDDLAKPAAKTPRRKGILTRLFSFMFK